MLIRISEISFVQARANHTDDGYIEFYTVNRLIHGTDQTVGPTYQMIIDDKKMEKLRDDITTYLESKKKKKIRAEKSEIIKKCGKYKDISSKVSEKDLKGIPFPKRDKNENTEES